MTLVTPLKVGQIRRDPDPRYAEMNLVRLVEVTRLGVETPSFGRRTGKRAIIKNCKTGRSTAILEARLETWPLGEK